jgi:hypothetical protein
MKTRIAEKTFCIDEHNHRASKEKKHVNARALPVLFFHIYN